MTINLADHPVGTRFVTRAGRPARLMAKDMLGDHPYLLAVSYSGVIEAPYLFTAAGLVEHSSGASETDLVAVAPTPRKVRVIACPNGIIPGRLNTFTILDTAPEFGQSYPSAVLDRVIDFEVPAAELLPVEQREAA